MWPPPGVPRRGRQEGPGDYATQSSGIQHKAIVLVGCLFFFFLFFFPLIFGRLHDLGVSRSLATKISNEYKRTANKIHVAMHFFLLPLWLAHRDERVESHRWSFVCHLLACKTVLIILKRCWKRQRNTKQGRPRLPGLPVCIPHAYAIN